MPLGAAGRDWIAGDRSDLAGASEAGVCAANSLRVGTAACAGSAAVGGVTLGRRSTGAGRLRSPTSGFSRRPSQPPAWRPLASSRRRRCQGSSSLSVVCARAALAAATVRLKREARSHVAWWGSGEEPAPDVDRGCQRGASRASNRRWRARMRAACSRAPAAARKARSRCGGAAGASEFGTACHDRGGAIRRPVCRPLVAETRACRIHDFGPLFSVRCDA